MGEREEGAAPGAERWRRVRALLEEALERPAPERAAFLAACPDANLRVEVERLLASEAAAERWLEPPGELPLVSDGETLDELPRLGPYRLVREIGAGGMGTVWLAVRVDGQFNKQVAIKRIHAGLAAPEVLERFRRERQVLANLDHPGIARLIDGGEDEDGRPYLVVEYVEGVTVDRWCDENRLTIEERVELFREVCEAVHHAHANLVVHRDIKPSNVLVTAEGRAKLLDFGIAKVLDPEKISAEPELTLGMGRFLTPSYASPEQLRGDPVTTASDVYSLGVLLYRLLSGRLPYRLAGKTAVEVQHLVCEVEPERPSTAVQRAPAPRDDADASTRQTPAELGELRLTTARGLERRLAGDLDRIVLKALRKEPRRRYSSAASLAEDLGRWRRGMPVEARPDTAAYRLSKLVRRHKAAAAATLLVLLSMAAALVASLTQYRRAVRAAEQELVQRAAAERRLEEVRRLAADLEAQTRLAEEQRARADEQRARAEARTADVHRFATQLVYDVHRAIAPLPGATEAKAAVVEMGLEFLDALSAEAGDDTDLMRELAGAYVRLGSALASPIENNLGRTAEGLVCLEKAVALAQRAADAVPEDHGAVFGLAQALLTYSEVLAVAGRPEDAGNALARGLAACRALPDGLATSRPGLLVVWAGLHDKLAWMLSGRGRKEEAFEHLEQAQELTRTVLARWPQLTSVRAGLSLNLTRRARLHAELGDVDRAIECMEQALSIDGELLEAQPLDVSRQRNLCSSLLQLGLLHSRRDEHELAVELVEDAVGRHRQLVEDDEAAVQARVELVDALGVLGGVLRRPDAERALEMFREQVVLARELHELDEENLHWVAELGTALSRLGGFEVERALLTVARDHLLEAAEILERVAERDPGRDTLTIVRSACDGSLGRAYELLADEADTASARRECLDKSKRWYRRGLEVFHAARADGRVPPASLEVGTELAKDLARVEARLSELGGEASSD